jgi:penicillin-binding protein 1A
MVRIDRRSGRKVFGTWPPTTDPKAAVIWEAFKPESDPRRAVRREDELADQIRAAVARIRASANRRVEQQQDTDFLQNEGGIY